MHIEHVGIYAHDTAILADWYARVLELQEVRRIERGAGKPPVVFLQGEAGVVVELLPTDEQNCPRSLSSPGFTHLGIIVNDIDDRIKRLAELGIEVSGVRSTSNGWTIGYFNDPEGNILELVQR